MTKKILDVCCGSRMWHFNKNNSNVLFMDNIRIIKIVFWDMENNTIKSIKNNRF